ncbi:MAG: hypothetical protein AAFR81_02330 [Chloroflexota bacterium]
MRQPSSKFHNHLFLFRPIHQPFVMGELDTLPTAVTRKRAVRQYVFLMFIIAAPMIAIITSLVAFAGYDYEWLFLVQVATALLTCAYFVLRRYLQDRILRHNGKVLYGEVIRHEMLPGYANISSSIITRIFYRFKVADDAYVVDSVDLGYAMNRLPDGRKYPEPGTSIAVLYANEKNHRLL